MSRKLVLIGLLGLCGFLAYNSKEPSVPSPNTEQKAICEANCSNKYKWLPIPEDEKQLALCHFENREAIQLGVFDYEEKQYYQLKENAEGVFDFIPTLPPIEPPSLAEFEDIKKEELPPDGVIKDGIVNYGCDLDKIHKSDKTTINGIPVDKNTAIEVIKGLKSVEEVIENKNETKGGSEVAARIPQDNLKLRLTILAPTQKSGEAVFDKVKASSPKIANEVSNFAVQIYGRDNLTYNAMIKDAGYKHVKDYAVYITSPKGKVIHQEQLNANELTTNKIENPIKVIGDERKRNPKYTGDNDPNLNNGFDINTILAKLKTVPIIFWIVGGIIVLYFLKENKQKS